MVLNFDPMSDLSYKVSYKSRAQTKKNVPDAQSLGGKIRVQGIGMQALHAGTNHEGLWESLIQHHPV